MRHGHRQQIRPHVLYITHLKVVYSTELPHKTLFQPEPEPGSTRRSTPGSVPFVPPVAGLIAASQVVKDLLAK